MEKAVDIVERQVSCEEVKQAIQELSSCVFPIDGQTCERRSEWWGVSERQTGPSERSELTAGALESRLSGAK